MKLKTFFPYPAICDLDDLRRMTSFANSLEQPTFDRHNVLSSVSDIRVHSDDDKYYFSIDVPGMKREHMTIQVEETKDNGRMFCLTGTRKLKQGSSVSEVKVERRVSLNNDADMDEIDANLEYGVLEITIKKKPKDEEKSTTKVIPINGEPKRE